MVLNIDKITKLHTPDNYMEYEGFETRLTVGKFLSFENTIRQANLALVYATEEEYSSTKEEETKEREIDFVRSVYLRNAILELNNSYDLLLQVPWFYYRVWENYNTGGNLVTRNLKNKHDIIRNVDSWVYDAEMACTENKIKVFMNNHIDTKLNSLMLLVQAFKDNYIFNENKNFTVRTLANQMKHNNTIEFKELREKVEKFDVNINDVKIDLKEKNQSLKLVNHVYENTNPDEIVCQITTRMNETIDVYDNEYIIDIDYVNGEEFRGEDYLRLKNLVGIQEVYDEAVDYGNGLIQLYEEFYKIVALNFEILPTLKSFPKVRETQSFNIDKYFKN